MRQWYPYKSRRRYTKSEGTQDAWIVDCIAIGKSNSNHCYTIANEFVSANLAHYLRLPVPPFALQKKKSPDTAMFASYSFEGDSKPWDVRADECYAQRPHLCTGILLFDILIANCDRHRGNIKVDKPIKPSQIHIFDHEHALFYVLPDGGIERLKLMRDRLGITGGAVTGNHHRHCFLDLVDNTDDIQDWAARIRGIPEQYVSDICEEILGVGVRRKEVNALKEFLLERRLGIGELMTAHQKEFAKIKNWPLFI